jgi:hypothetical protein
MVSLAEALEAERIRREQEEADVSARMQVARAVLGALADKLKAEPLPGWTFVLEDQAIRIVRTVRGPNEKVGTWTMDNQMQLVCAGASTEWITSESYGRVFEEALQITARLIVDAELEEDAKKTVSSDESANVIELPQRM